MSRVLKLRLRIAIGLVAGVCALSAGSALALVDTRPVDVKAREWAEKGVGLPTTLDELAAYSGEYRHAAFIVMSPPQKSQLYQDQLQIIKKTWKLTSDQEQFVSDAMKVLTPAMYEKNRTPEETELGMALCKRVANLFSKDQAALFTSVGPPTKGRSESPAVVWTRVVKRWLGTDSVAAATKKSEGGFCNCLGSTYCQDCNINMGWGCDYMSPCWETPNNGCGCFSMYTCDGKCAYIGDRSIAK